MVQYLKSVDITADRIILITPPPLQESAWEKECLAKGKGVMRMGGISAFYQWSVGDRSQVVRWFPLCVCHIAVKFSDLLEKGCCFTKQLLDKLMEQLPSNYKCPFKVLIDLLMHRTDRRGHPLRTWGLSTCPRQITSCPSSFQNIKNNGRNVGTVGLRKFFTSYSRFHICLFKQ